MLFVQLKTKWINLQPKEQQEIDFGQNGAILVPSPNSKVFIHWLTEKGNVRTTFTMTHPTKVFEKARIINGGTSQVDIQILNES